MVHDHDPYERISRIRLPPRVSTATRRRMQASACVTRTRYCARCVLCWLAFPLAFALGSTGSAADRSTLFVGFLATMAESDFSYDEGVANRIGPEPCAGIREECRRSVGRGTCAAQWLAWHRPRAVRRHPRGCRRSVGRG
jgi:hypothetical protein